MLGSASPSRERLPSGPYVRLALRPDARRPGWWSRRGWPRKALAAASMLRDSDPALIEATAFGVGVPGNEVVSLRHESLEQLEWIGSLVAIKTAMKSCPKTASR